MENNGRFLQQQQQQQQLALQQQAFAPLAQQMLTNPSFVSVFMITSKVKGHVHFLKNKLLYDEFVIHPLY